MNREKFVFTGLILALCLIAPGMAGTPPSLPMAVIGTVNIDGLPAPAGTVVSAAGSSITVTQTGVFGGTGTFDPKIQIQGIPTGSPVSFSVNGNPNVLIKVGSATGTSLSYIPGDAVVAEVNAYSQPPSPPGLEVPPVTFVPMVITPIPKPIPTQQPVQVPTPSCNPVSSPVQLPSSVIRDEQIYPSTCPELPRHAPPGFGVLRVGAWGSEAKFYLNNTLISNGGPVTIWGIKPGSYTLSYRETGNQPQDIPVIIGSDRFVTVSVNPREDTSFVWNRENIDPWYSKLSDRTMTTGVLGICTNMPYKGSTSIDGVVVSQNCDVGVFNLAPGFHTVTISLGGYTSTYPVVIGAGTTTYVNGGSPVKGMRCSGQLSTCGGSTQEVTCRFDPVPVGELYHGLG